MIFQSHRSIILSTSILALSLLCFQGSVLFARKSSILLSQEVAALKDTTFEHRYSNYTQLLSPEKLYLHTDRTQYCVGDTIWFKGYLLNSSLESEFSESNFLYVELIIYPFAKEPFSGNIQEEALILRRIKVKRREGILQGYIPITDECVTGGAVLRAYTHWNLNRAFEYISYKNITIINPIKDKYVEELKEKKERTPEIYTGLGVENPFKEKEKKRDVSCVFLPESGRYLLGERGAIGIKAIDETGLGIQVEGTVYDKDGEEITTFITNQYGFAKIYLSPISSQENYTAKIRDGRGVEKSIKLPSPEREGVAVTMQRRGANIISRIAVSDKYNKDSLYFLLCNSTEVYYNEPISKVERLSIPQAGMAAGINNALVVDAKGNILAKRPFFVMPEIKDTVTFTTNKQRYGKRELVRGKISLGRPITGDFSISVTDDELAPYDSLSGNILTHMLLGSELRGHIENPQQYFDNTKPIAEREEMLDMLLITQGWEYYDLPKILKGEYEQPKYGREYIQSIAGRVKRSVFRKKAESVISFVAPKINFAAIGDLDEEGYFELKDIDFPDSTQFIVNATDAGGKNKKSFFPTIYEDTFAGEVEYIRTPKNRIKYTPKVAEILTNRYYEEGGTQAYTLNTVTVYGKKRTMPDLSPISNFMFKPTQIREKKDMYAYEKHGYDLISYIADEFHLKYRYNEYGSRILLCKVFQVGSRMSMNGPRGVPAKVYINGMEVPTGDLEGYVLEEVEKVAYVPPHEAGPFALLYQMPSKAAPGIIMVKTKLRKFSQRPRNISNGTPLGWQKPKAFYAPEYDVKGKNIIDTEADRRSTIYWNPSVVLNTAGNADFKFNTSDGAADYTVIIEGITSDGEYVFSKHKIEILEYD